MYYLLYTLLQLIFYIQLYLTLMHQSPYPLEPHLPTPTPSYHFRTLILTPILSLTPVPSSPTSLTLCTPLGSLWCLYGSGYIVCWVCYQGGLGPLNSYVRRSSGLRETRSTGKRERERVCCCVFCCVVLCCFVLCCVVLWCILLFCVVFLRPFPSWSLSLSPTHYCSLYHPNPHLLFLS